jgi:hypothetical protein
MPSTSSSQWDEDEEDYEEEEEEEEPEPPIVPWRRSRPTPGQLPAEKPGGGATSKQVGKKK